MNSLDALVNPFKDLESDSPDKIKKVNFENDEMLNRAWDYLTAFDFNSHDYKYVNNYFDREKVKYILSPAQITIFFEAIKKLPEKLRASESPIFVSQLIHHSYKNGHNGFVLYPDDKIFDALGFAVEGKEGSMLELTIHGAAGKHLGRSSKYAHIEVDGDADSFCGAHAENSNIIVKGSAGSYFGSFSENSYFEVFGDVVGQVSGRSARSATYVCHNKKAYDTLQNCLDNSKGNRVILRE